MYPSLSRFLLACLLLVALPLKGLAATSMLACGPDHHRTSLVVHADHAESTWHSHGNGETPHQHAVNGSLERPLHLAGSADKPDSGTHANAAHGKLECNNCAPCCAGAALVNASPTPIFIPVYSADYPPSFTLHRSAPVARLERPPRTLLV